MSRLSTFGPCAVLVCCLLGSEVDADNSVVQISAFSQLSTLHWKEHSFARNTRYRLRQIGSQWALSAESEAAASVFYRSVEIDLEKTPWLSWRWRVEQALSGLDERSKAGDDYAARVYVVHKRGVFDKGVAINYVWSSDNLRGSAWPNAFAAASSKMLALRDARTALAQWQSERRNVRKDFQRLFDRDIRTVQVVAVMTDTDNSGKSAHAHYGELAFSGD